MNLAAVWRATDAGVSRDPSRSLASDVMSVTADASKLAARAAWSADHRDLEADLRSDLAEPLTTAALAAGLPRTALRQEGVGLAGRFDSLFGDVLVEYKRPGLLASEAARSGAAQQALDYLEDETLGARAVMVTDGRTIGFLRETAGDVEVGEQATLPFTDLEHVELPAAARFTWRPFDEPAAQAALDLIGAQRLMAVSARTVADYLGPGRAETLALLSALADALGERAAHGRTATLFQQWVSTAGVPYGIARPDAPWPSRPSRERLLGTALDEALGGRGFAEAIFALHTYVALAAKAIAAEVLAIQHHREDLRPSTWSTLSDADLPERLRALERGETADQLGAPGLLASDLFDWYAYELSNRPDVRDGVRALLRRLGGLAWVQIATAGGVRIDLLRELYQAVVPAGLRRSLGEFFTPRWLAQQVLGRALELYRERPETAERPRLLDPTCGSGTFLVAWLDHLLASLDRAGLGQDPDALQEALDRVLGVDVNPVSAIMARVNLLLTLGDRARLLPEVVFNVFHADSIILPRITAQGELREGAGGDRSVISTAAGDFEVATCLLTRPHMAALRRNLEWAVREGRSGDEFLALLESEIDEVPADDLATMRATATTLLGQMSQLHLEQRNDVWARVIEQAVAPRLLGDVELCVGNPPWVSWKNLPAAWKTRSEPLWRSYGLWSRSRAGRGTPLADISTLVLARALSTYAPRGLVAMLLPQSVLLADPGGAPFRRSRLQPADADRQGVGDLDLPFRLLAVEDHVAVSPFRPDASNLTVALFLVAGETPRFPLPQRVWSRADGRRLEGSAAWETIGPRLRSENVPIEPVDPADVCSPWGVAIEGALPLRPRHDAYALGRGYETRGLDGLFTFRLLTERPAAGRVRIVNEPEEGMNTRGETAREATVESDLLWPLVKGEDVERWRVRGTSRYWFVPYIPCEQVTDVTVERCRARSPRLYRYLAPWIPRFKARSGYRSAFSDDFPWALSGPTDHLKSSGALLCVRYLATRGRPGAAVVVARDFPELGRTTLPIPNNKSNIYYCDEDEAHYLAAFINSSPAQEALGRFAVSTGVTPAAIGRLPLPRFDAQDQQHRALSDLGRAAAAAVDAPDELANVERNVDTAVRRISS